MMQPPLLPAEVRHLAVVREQFITAQHFVAWTSGTPLRRHIPGRKKFSWDLKAQVYREHGRKCAVCGRTDYLTIDHIVPVELGGATCARNSRVLCEEHNRRAWAVFRPYVRLLDKYLEEAA